MPFTWSSRLSIIDLPDKRIAGVPSILAMRFSSSTKSPRLNASAYFRKRASWFLVDISAISCASFCIAWS